MVGARLFQEDADIRRGDSVSREHESLVDSAFFQLFDLPLIAGDKAALAEPGRVVITESMARKYLPHG